RKGTTEPSLSLSVRTPDRKAAQPRWAKDQEALGMVSKVGRVVLLVGPSCAGKSTLAKALQEASPTPFLDLSLDGLFASVPERWGGQGDLASEGFRYEW